MTLASQRLLSGLELRNGGADYLLRRLPGETPHVDDDFFDDEVVGGTAVTPTGTATWTEARGALSVGFSGQSTSDLAARLYPMTPSAVPVTIETFTHTFRSYKSANPMCGLVFSNGTDATSNAVAIGIYVTTSAPTLASFAGTLTSMAPTNIRNTIMPEQFPSQVGLRFIWTATNTWAYSQSSQVGNAWSDYGGADISATLAPTHFGMFVSTWGGPPSSVDFAYLRVYEADLSV